MDKKAQIESALKDAMRAGDEVKKRTLRLAISSIRFVEVEKGRPLDDDGVTAILQKEVKTRQEAIDEAQSANRADLVEKLTAEIAVLESYLPEQLSGDELEALARQAISETGAQSAADMGKVMKNLMPRLRGRATGDQASQVVRKLLQ